MKKILAFIMILALLIPMGTIAHAEEAEVKPFYIIQWSNFKSELSYNWYMPYFWANSGRMNQPLESIAWNNEYDISKMAKNLKELIDTYPDGTRYINYNLVGTAFDVLQEDVIFVDKGVEVSQQWLSAFLKEYHALGGKLDGLSTGIAFEDLYAVYVHDRYAKKDPMILCTLPIFVPSLRSGALNSTRTSAITHLKFTAFILIPARSTASPGQSGMQFCAAISTVKLPKPAHPCGSIIRKPM